MDRFKFRYFNKLSNKMVEPKNWQNIDSIFGCLKQQVCFDENISLLPYNHIGNGLVFMQCTGLKDKHGRLIFEGDILKGKKDMICSPHSSKMVDKIGVVEIPEGMFVATVRDVKNNCTLFCQYDWNKTEVIGNIYENKELIDVGRS